ncbi:MAG: hypothetical protein LRY43_02615 [Gammaproteobacteria bacterium]|nr:hypothetical protein [Gammaproteobacteria bacterium]
MKDFETVSKLKKEIEEILMSDNRVVSVGTVKEKDLDGKDTGFFFNSSWLGFGSKP